VTNRFAGFYPASPGLVRLENLLMATLARVVGMDAATAGGVLSSGGTTATISAVVAARDAFAVTTGGRAFAAWRATVADANPALPPAGASRRHPEEFVAYVAAEAHGCVRKALNVAGCAGVTVRAAPLDRTRRVDAAALRAMVAADRAAGLVPWLLVATAGTVNCGVVDPLDALADIAGAPPSDRPLGADGVDVSSVAGTDTAAADRAPAAPPAFGEGESTRLWFHIDGAYGGLLALAPGLRAALAGLGRADSLVVDPHKALFLPFGTAAVLLREPARLLESHHSSGAYLARFQDTGALGDVAAVRASCDHGLELSKHNRVFRLWFPLALFGLAPFRACLTEKAHLARWLHAALARVPMRRGGDSGDAAASPPLFELGPPPELTIVTYRVAAAAVAASGGAGTVSQDWATGAVLGAVRRDGRVFVSDTVLDGAAWLRACVLHFRTRQAHLDLLVRVLTDAARSALGCV